MYGQVAASLRQTMTELLAIQKVSIHLGKGYGYTAGQDVTTPEERLAAVDRIMRYRAEIVDYCWRAATTVIPAKASKGWEAPRRVERWLESRRPEAGQLPGERRASADELAAVQDIPLVELWRRAAVAAFTGRERELPLFPERIDVEQARVVVSDVAQLTNALLFLDRRCFQTSWPTSRPACSSTSAWSRRGPTSPVSTKQQTRSAQALSLLLMPDSPAVALLLHAMWPRTKPR